MTMLAIMFLMFIVLLFAIEYADIKKEKEKKFGKKSNLNTSVGVGFSHKDVKSIQKKMNKIANWIYESDSPISEIEWLLEQRYDSCCDCDVADIEEDYDAVLNTNFKVN